MVATREELQTWELWSGSRASRPGRVRAHRWLWVLHRPIWIVAAIGALMPFFICLALTPLAGDEAFFLLYALVFFKDAWFLYLDTRYWEEVQYHYHAGCTNAGVVISKSPPRIAVLTDLSKGGRDYPVIRVIHGRIWFAQEPVMVGRKVATVAMYQPDPLDDVRMLPHWVDFDPRPVEWVNREPQVVQRCLDVVPDDDWERLRLGLEQLAERPEPGLYPVTFGPEDWVDGRVELLQGIYE